MKSKFFEKETLIGIAFCLVIAIPAWFLGKAFPILGGPVFGILFGMVLAFLKRPEKLDKGIRFTSKYILQYAIVLLGFEMNLFNAETGARITLSAPLETAEKEEKTCE